MNMPWLHIIGIGEDGTAGLTQPARDVLACAETIIGGARHHELSAEFQAERLVWPSPFNALLDIISERRGRCVAVLVSGDPSWFSAGSLIAEAFPSEEIGIYPHLSAFQLAAIRMKWRMQTVHTLSVHGRPAESVTQHLEPGAKIVLLTSDGDTPNQIAALLRECGYGPSRMTVFAAMGGLSEERFDGVADAWSRTVPALNTLCIECVPEENKPIWPHIPGLPDESFRHDGKMTKREARAVTLAKLAPTSDALLWDIGAGCGSVGIEWIRSARNARAIGIEPLAERREFASLNASRLGAASLKLVPGKAPEALKGLDTPDAIFIGGGLGRDTVLISWAALPARGRLVANAVTLESEALLIALHREMGGELTKIAVSHVRDIGGYRGWKPQMAVTQWSIVK